MAYSEYIRRNIINETPKAWLVEQQVNNRRDGNHKNFKWVAKSQCKGYQELHVAEITFRSVEVPEWLVSNGVWD